jgi:hypothetical protein
MDNAAITTNAATIVLDGPNSLIVTQSNANVLSGFATNTCIGSFTIQNGRTFTTAGAFTNAGTVTAAFNGRFMTTGAYTQLGGLTDLKGGVLSATGGVSIQGGGLAGPGIVDANVTNAGVLTPGGDSGTSILTITGNYTQTAAGVLGIDIGGLVAGTGYDQLQINGLATLDGTLNVQLVGGFVPQPGDTFRILTFGSLSGDFAAENGLDLGRGIVLRPSL